LCGGFFAKTPMADGRRAAGSLVDGIAAAGTNLVGGLIALRILPTEELAVYALLTTGAVLIGLASQQTVLAPQRAHVNRLDALYRPAFGRDARLLAAFSPVMTLLVMVSGAALIDEIPAADFVALAVTCAAWTLSFPFFAHVRASAHIVDRSTAAAGSSILSLAIASGGLVVAMLMDDWLPAGFPFGVLAVASAAGVALCWARLRNVPSSPSRERLTFAVMRGHSVAAVTTEATTYIIMVIAATVLTVTQLADLEVARLASSPIFIILGALGVGLLPAAIRRFHTGDDLPLRRAMRRLLGFGAAVSVLAPLMIAVSAGLLSWLFGRDLDPSLGAARAFANAAVGTASHANSVQLSRRRYSAAARHAVGAGAASIVVMIVAVGHLGVFAIPVSLTVGAVIRIVLGRRVAVDDGA
jgi:O-antigen/teichoic acid export membrane protein